MRVLQRCPGRLAMILENQNVFEPPVFFQVQYPVPKCPQNILNALRRQRRHAGRVIGRLDNDLVGPNPIHAIKHSFSLTVQRALDTQRRKLIGDYAHRPSRCIPLRRRATIGVRPVGLNFRGCLGFVSVTERAETALDLHVFAREIRRALRSISRDNDPTSNDGVFSKLRQVLNPFSTTQTCYFTPTRKRSEIPRSLGGNCYLHSIRLQYRFSTGTMVEPSSGTDVPPTPIPAACAGPPPPRAVSHPAMFLS